MSHRIQEEDKIGSFVNLTSKDATNLKNVLKKIIAEVTGGETGKEDNDDDLVVNVGYLSLYSDMRKWLTMFSLDISITTYKYYAIGVEIDQIKSLLQYKIQKLLIQL